jgi:transcription antitermination protein NusB
MGVRRNAREAVLQFLFQDDFLGLDSGQEEAAEERFADFCTLYDIQKKARPYALSLLKGISSQRSNIDDLIRKCASNWRLERIDVTDRNILRIAVYEMTFQDDVPPEVAINEAVEVAKRFGTGDSPAFINGVLDSIKGLLV